MGEVGDELGPWRAVAMIRHKRVGEVLGLLLGRWLVRDSGIHGSLEVVFLS